MMNATRAEMMWVSALISLAAAGCSARTQAPVLPQPDSARSMQIAPGVTHTYQWFANGPYAVHTITIEPNTCGINFRTIKAQDSRVGREQTSAMAQRTQASINGDVVAAVNADFFSFDPPGVPEGPQVSNGVLLKSEGAHREALEDRRVVLRPVFAVDRAGKPVATFTRLTGTVSVGNQTVPLAGVNTPARQDSAFVFTRFWGDATAVDSAATEIIVRGGVVAAVDTLPDGVAIPDDGVVIVVKGTARTTLATAAPGTTARWQAELSGLAGAREVVGGYPMLLQDGNSVYADEPGLRAPFSDRRHPRAAIGIDRSGRIYIVAVDGRQPGHSEGMSLQELTEFLQARGITDALNLDGGGSTTLVVRGQIVNRPSDTNGERAVANALLLLDEGAAAGCARSP